MNKTRIIFLRHAETEKDAQKNAALWGLSKKGTEGSRKVAKELEREEIDIVYVSEEKKTSLTADPIVKRISKKPLISSFFNEVKRGDEFLSKEDFEKEKKLQLTDLNYHAFSGESGAKALLRFKKGVERVTKENEGKTILIVTHGTILNIYFAYVFDCYDHIFDRWEKTGFCAYGIMEDGKIVKDIVFA